LLIDCQRALVERLGFRVSGFGFVNSRQVAEALGHVRVLGSQDLFPDRQRALIERLGLLVVALVLVE
jgi:hypothetical protein